MFLDELKSLEQAKRLVHWSADWQIVDRNLSHNALWIDEKEAAQGDSLLLDEHIVVARNALVEIAQERIGEAAEAAVLAIQIDPTSSVI